MFLNKSRWFVIVLLVVTAWLRADVVVLKSGDRVTGEIVRETDDAVVLRRVFKGSSIKYTQTIKRSAIARIDKGQTATVAERPVRVSTRPSAEHRERRNRLMTERRELLQAALAYWEERNYKPAAIALTRVISNSTEPELRGFSAQVEQRLKMPLVELAAETRMRAAHAESRGRAIRLRYVTRYEKPALVPRLLQVYKDALLKEISARPDSQDPSAPPAAASRPARTNTKPASSGTPETPSNEAESQPNRTYRINDWLDRPREFDGDRAESEAFAQHIRYTISVLKARMQFDSQLRTNRAMRDALRREKVQLADLLEAVVARAGGALTTQERAERRLELRRMQEEYLKALQQDMEARQEQIRQAQKEAGFEIKAYGFSSEPQPIEEDASNQATPPNPEKE